LFFLLADIAIICASLYLSFLAHFEFDFDIAYLELVKKVVLYFVVLKLFTLTAFRIYKITWRYVGICDLTNIFLASLISELVLLALSLPTSFLPHLAITGLSKRIFFIDGGLTFSMIAALRVSKRLYLEVIPERRHLPRGKNTLIVGAGNAGEMMLRDMIRNSFKDFYPIGFLDDDLTKVGSFIHNVKVLGTTDQLGEMVPQRGVEAIIIAIPTLNHKVLRRLYDGAKKARVETIKIVPRIYDFTRPDINMKTLESIKIEDLMGRQSISVDYRGIRNFIRGKSVLVTGAGGSIGSEIAMQMCAFGPGQAILLDIDETELHNLDLKLRRLFPQLLEHIFYVTGDVRDKVRMREIFDAWRPEIVFHAAAYKHVPMMEYNPKEAVKVNIFGTYVLASAARNHNVERFIMISTDKAVCPTSVMGATKRMAEYICSALDDQINGDGELLSRKGKTAKRDSCTCPTRFISVRFGNVLGSRGSVLPMFLEQLKYGGPLTVTHREVKRYFMTIPEAVSLVLQASILGEGGEVFVLDMGNPVKIIDIAEELIKIHGMEPYKDIDIQFTELRPGEKLFEEILTAEEGTHTSRHEKIFIAKNGVQYPLAELRAILNEFSEVIADPSLDSHHLVKLLLKKYVKTYRIPEEIQHGATSQWPSGSVSTSKLKSII
jgi:FlaA1/EpsC-like NDP-sugar epimerase